MTGRVAVVTGASSGIGRGIAKRLAADGVNVVTADVTKTPRTGEHYQTGLTTPTNEVIESEYDVESRFIETDVSDEASVRGMIDEILDEFGSLDHLVNNAGIVEPGTSQETSVDDWNNVVDINLTGYFMTAKFAIPHLVKSPQGRIVNVSSVNAHFGGAGPSYASTKAAIVNLTRDLAVELGPDNVTVNAVLPGVIKTPLQDVNDEETRREQQKKTILPRLGEPEDCANAVSFFCSEDAEWITGANLAVDGGFLAGGY
ncbi:SDR family NAD(P)-dependent oxidoreductase [Halovenus marina]|uniref:SDR family NAD(P)-dependent oxidoreductase n=1 Tax=Halovenus marina TaxID=3396621 RepID=UPI003F55269A